MSPLPLRRTGSYGGLVRTNQRRCVCQAAEQSLRYWTFQGGAAATGCGAHQVSMYFSFRNEGFVSYPPVTRFQN